jgi:hypothetical protein
LTSYLEFGFVDVGSAIGKMRDFGGRRSSSLAGTREVGDAAEQDKQDKQNKPKTNQIEARQDQLKNSVLSLLLVRRLT